jgi:integrase
MVFLPAGRDTYKLKVPTSRMDGNRRVTVKRTTHTKDRKLALAMAALVDELADTHRAWDVLDRIAAGTLAVPALWDLWARAGKHLPTLRALLNDKALTPLVDAWAPAATAGRLGYSAAEGTRYVSAVRAFVEGDMTLATLTPQRIGRYLDDMDAQPATVRKHAAAVSAFCRWLVARGDLEVTPMDRVTLPPAGPPRTRYLDTPDVIRLADAMPELHRALCLILAATGMDLSTALAVRVRDVDGDTIHARGTKSVSRDRIVTVATFARFALAGAVRGKLPDALLFDGIPSRWNASDMHRDTVAALVADGHAVFDGYWLRDHRHTCAVRLVRAGVPFAHVAAQLGHANEQLVARVYGRFVPDAAERKRWESQAVTAEKRRAKKA